MPADTRGPTDPTNNPKTETIEILASDISRPSISLVTSPPNAFTSDKLCEAKGNWRDWKWAMEGTIGLTPLWDYIQGYVPCPAPDREPRAYRNWMSNDRMARLYIDSAMDLDEAKAMNVRDIKPATTLWSTLQRKYENLGAVNQFSLLEQVFSTDLEDGDNLLKSFNAGVELATRAYGSKLTKNTFQVLALTRMISRIPSLSHIKTTIYTEVHRAAKAGNRDTYTIEDVRELITQRQSEIITEKRNNQATALATTSHHKKSDKPPVVCSNCKGLHHSAEFCIRDGGGMEGKTVEQSKEARRKAREAARNGGKTTKKESSANASTSEPTPTVNFASFFPLPSVNVDQHPDLAPRTDPEQPEVWFSLEEITSSIDWNTHTIRTEIPDSAKIASPIPEALRTFVPPSTSPFLLDSGSSIHLTPHREDFETLRPITPRPIKGVGGSCIEATGAGTIRLPISGNSSVALQNALFVPTACVRLISVYHLTKDSHITAHFDDQRCWLTQNSDNALPSSNQTPSETPPSTTPTPPIATTTPSSEPDSLDYDEEDLYHDPDPQPLDDLPPPHNPTPPAPAPPKRSNRIADAAANGSLTREDRLQRAIQESREAAARRKQHRDEQQAARAVRSDLEQLPFQDVDDTQSLVSELEVLLTSLNVSPHSFLTHNTISRIRDSIDFIFYLF
ncbi:hypothetical protein CVT24_010767 [Panaeolus cyanescens]|uniref:Retrovirus-related Pol polyprotein from transposon TNT 1-94-like beta-barrel domain-containing protein n=1 Tax=Panaeolus cyanescens TaxID=181874 RepID=A0A409YVT1_9AGAR|nr:hypothetical protein CVT24_010767 [Panaeolus cyanescens]